MEQIRKFVSHLEEFHQFSRFFICLHSSCFILIGLPYWRIIKLTDIAAIYSIVAFIVHSLVGPVRGHKIDENKRNISIRMIVATPTSKWTKFVLIIGGGAKQINVFLVNYDVSK